MEGLEKVSGTDNENMIIEKMQEFCKRMKTRINRDILSQDPLAESKKKQDGAIATPMNNKKRKREEFYPDEPEIGGSKRLKPNNYDCLKESTRLVNMYAKGISQTTGENHESKQKSQVSTV